MEFQQPFSAYSQKIKPDFITASIWSDKAGTNQEAAQVYLRIISLKRTSKSQLWTGKSGNCQQL